MVIIYPLKMLRPHIACGRDNIVKVIVLDTPSGQRSRRGTPLKINDAKTKFNKPLEHSCEKAHQDQNVTT